MSSRIAPAEAPHPEDTGLALGLRMLLLLAYPVLSHLASLRDDGRWSALALASLVLLMLLGPLLHRRLWALGALAAALAGLYALAGSRFAWMTLLAPPVLFTLVVAWGFARTLRRGQVPLITRIVRALHEQARMPMPEATERYTRRLTAAWALLLATLAAINLALALIAAPDGVLWSLGVRSRWAITHAQWSWFANLACWGLIGGFAAVEYAVRQRRVEEHPYRTPVQFVRQLMQLGPAFWRELLR
ncbi:hypothetical protein [Pseudomonas sp. Hp2]|uniref:hypothetical protein n=1 Tax=Pseudomonas sp. Hp2 TaxID=701189 RepID=UPI001C49C998|nr:hypothetical protein [Pseudomonas sp. Hp2]